MTTMTFKETPEVLRELSAIIRQHGTCAPMALEMVAEVIDAHLAKGAQVPDEMKSLYEAASKGFHTSESFGPDHKYWHVSKFQSLEELHAFIDAWTRTMLLAKVDFT